MKLSRILASFTLILTFILAACDSNPTPTPTVGVPTPAPATNPTTLAMSATATSAPSSLATSTVGAATSTPVTMNLPTATSAAQATVTAVAAVPTAASTSGGERIFFVGNNDAIYSIKPDGSDLQTVIKVNKTEQQSITALSASPDGKYLAYGLTNAETYAVEYYLVGNGAANEIEGISTLPVWYGYRFVTNAANGPNGEVGQLLLFNDNSNDPEGAGLGVSGTNPTWAADGSKIYYLDDKDNIYSIGSNPPPYGNPPPNLVLQLNEQTAGDNEDYFGISFLAATPDGKSLIIGGEQIKNVGAQGNGQRLWTLDLHTDVASRQLIPFTENGGRFGGSNNYGFSSPDTLVIASNFHISACASGAAISVLGVGPGGVAADVTLPDISGDTYGLIYGLSVAPPKLERNGPYVAYSLQPYTCPDAAAEPQTQPISLYIWNNDGVAGEQNTKISEGRYPLWVDTSTVVPPAPTFIPGESLPPTITPSGSNSQLIFYLAADGHTINTMKPNGGDANKLVTQVDLKEGQRITDMSASLDGEYLAYAVTHEAGTHSQTDYYLVLDGLPTKIENAYSLPRWQGHRFIAKTLPDADGNPGELAIYEANKGNGFVARGLTVQADDFAWYPDGSAIAYYDSNNNIHKLPRDPNSQPTDLLILNPNANTNQYEQWQLYSIAITANDLLLFAGGKQKDLGLVGEGQKIWSYDLASVKGADGLVPLSDEARYNLVGFLGSNTALLYQQEHGGACGSIPHFKMLDINNGTLTEAVIPAASPDGRYTMQGITPATSGSSFAYAVAAYNCDNTDVGPATIYRADSTISTKIGDGSFPVWFDPSLKL